MNKPLLTTVSARPNRAKRFLRELKFTLAALEAGSRTMPLGDNHELVRDLSARAAELYGAV